MYKVGIIDHVGSKSGMDIYDISLANKISLNAQVYILSNFKFVENQKKGVILKKTFDNSNDGSTIIKKSKYFFKGFFKSFRYLKQNKCSKIILHSFSFEYKDLIITAISKLMGFQLLLIVHDVSGFANNDSGFVKSLILNVLTNKILVHNEFSKQELIDQKLTSSKIITIRHGGYVDFVSTSITKNEALSELKLNSNFKYVLFFGQIKEVKGLDILIKAFSNITDLDVKLIIAGKPWKDDFSKYEDLIAETNLKNRIVLFKRFITDAEKDILFNISDVVVIPYKKIFQSGVLLTALSYSSVVLCSDLEPNREIISNGKNGFLFKSNNIESLSSALISVLNESPSKIKTIKKNALKTVETDYSWDYAAKEILKILN